MSEFKNMLSKRRRRTFGGFTNYSWSWWNRILRLGFYVHENVPNVERKQGYKIRELNYQEGDVAGVKTVTLEIDGEYAFGYLKAKTEFTVW